MVDEEGAKDLSDAAAAIGDDSSQQGASPGVEQGPRVSPVPPPRASDKPVAAKGQGPLMPMRIIGVNASPAQPPAPPAETLEAPTSARPPASIPPPKPSSTRPSKPPAPPAEYEVDTVQLKQPAPPADLTVEVEEIEPAPASDLPTEPVAAVPASEPSVPVGPPPFPAERRSNPSLPSKDTGPDSYNLPPPLADAPVLPAMAAPPAAPLRAPRSDGEPVQTSEPPPPNPRAGFDAPTPPETPALRAEVIAARAALEAKGGDRSKPPALPNRKRMTSDGEALSSPSAEIPSQPPIDGTTKPKKRRPPPIPPPRSTFTGATEEEAAKRRPWWEEVFSDDFLRAIAELNDAQLAREVDFIESSFNLEKPAAILDLACGSGRHAVELTKRGYTTVGYDLSVTQLARASETAQQAGAKVAFLHGDMREMGFEQMFDAVLLWNASFGYFEEEKNLAVLRNIHRALKPGGCLLLDIPNRDFVVAHQPSQNWFEGDGCVCMDDMHVDFITSRLCVKRTIMLDDGRNKETLYSIRLFGLHELGRMLHEIGFRVNEVTGHVATRGVFMGNTSPRLITLVTKR